MDWWWGQGQGVRMGGGEVGHREYQLERPAVRWNILPPMACFNMAALDRWLKCSHLFRAAWN